MIDYDNDSLPGRFWDTVVAIASTALAVVFGLVDQLLAFGDTLLNIGGVQAIAGAVWAQSPTLFTMLSVAQSQFRGLLVTVMPIGAWQGVTVGVGVLFLLKLGDRFTDDLWARLRP